MPQAETTSERRVYQDRDPNLYEELEGTMFSGGTKVQVEGKRFNVARDRDEEDKAYFILTPAG